MKAFYIKDLKPGVDTSSSFMITKILYKDAAKTIIILGDITGTIKSSISDADGVLKVGDVLMIRGILKDVLEIKEFNILKEFALEDYIPSVERPMDEIMQEIEDISKEEFNTPECIALNNYFFKNSEFIEKFKKGIGGVSQHHNYIGGLAEHTLNVMYLTKTLAYRYNCRNKELAILAAKLHDIGKTEEYNVDGPFSFTLKGDMEGHIVIGITMLEEAFNNEKDLYTDEFKSRMKGCIVQHHGKLEYGSPKKPNTEEAYIVHYADSVDAVLNKIAIVKKNVEPNTWSEYDRRLEGKIYV